MGSTPYQVGPHGEAAALAKKQKEERGKVDRSRYCGFCVRNG